MLANKDSTSSTMLRALAFTSNALDGAIQLDVDCTDDDRAFFQAEKAKIDALFEQVSVAERAVFLHELREKQKHQARVVIGDAVLDRGVRAGKKRVTLEKDLATADKIFGEDISEIVNAEREVEPQLVLQSVDQLAKTDDFPGKGALVADLTGRAQRQAQNFTDRTAAERVETDLDNCRGAIYRAR